MVKLNSSSSSLSTEMSLPVAVSTIEDLDCKLKEYRESHEMAVREWGEKEKSLKERYASLQLDMTSKDLYIETLAGDVKVWSIMHGLFE